MDGRRTDDLVRWNPELSPEAEAYASELHAQIAPRIGLMVRIRKALGMTQSDVAKSLLVTQGAVSKQERSRHQGLAAISALARSGGARVVLQIVTAQGQIIDLSDDIDLIGPPAILETSFTTRT